MAEESAVGGFVTFFIGLAIGAAAAILFAPQSGDETRELLGKAARQSKDCASDIARELQTQLETSFAGAKEKLHEALEAGKTAYWTEINQARG